MLVRSQINPHAGEREPNLRAAQSAKSETRRVFGPLSLAQCFVFRLIRVQGEG